MLKRLNKGLTKYIQEKYQNWDVSIALRYLPIIEDINKNFGIEAKVLDVGSGEFGLATYAKGGFNITGTDIDFGLRREKNLKIVKASADALPFPDNSFDAVVSVDMMEHLPPQIRKKAVSEMVRVARGKVYLSFPTGSSSHFIDALLSKYYKLTHGQTLGYLKEHLELGLPDTKVIENFIKKALLECGKKGAISKKGNTNSVLWLILLLMGFSEVKLLTSLYHKFLLLLPILNFIHFWPTYRVAFTVELKNQKKLRI